MAGRLVTAAMRAGYAARGVVYAAVGVLALGAAADGGAAEGLVGAVQRLGGASRHAPVLLALAVGLALYSVWRGLDSIVNLAGHSAGFGVVERFGLFFVAALHLVFAWYVARLALGTAPDGGGRDPVGTGISDAVASLIAHPWGRWFVALVGIGTASFGAFSVWKGVSARYRKHMRRSRAVERLAPLLGFGLVARGLVFVLMGWFVAWAAWALDPGSAGGFGDTLERIHRGWHGRLLLGLAGAGLIAFSGYCFVESAFRVIPPRPGGRDA